MRTLLGLIFSEGSLRAIGTMSLILLAVLLMFWFIKLLQLTVDSVPSGSLDQFVPTPQNILPPKPRNGLSLEETVVGIYELKDKKDIFKQDFRAKGIMEEHKNDKKLQEYKWEIINGAVHITDKKGMVYIFNINPDSSLTGVATILSGKRTDFSIDKQPTYKKIPKEPVEGGLDGEEGGFSSGAPKKPKQPPIDPNAPDGKRQLWTYGSGQLDIAKIYVGKGAAILPKNFGQPANWKKQGKYLIYTYDKMRVRFQNKEYNEVYFILEPDPRADGGAKVVSVRYNPKSGVKVQPAGGLGAEGFPKK